MTCERVYVYKFPIVKLGWLPYIVGDQGLNQILHKMLNIYIFFPFPVFFILSKVLLKYFF